MWDRPIFVVDGEPRTLYSATFTTRTTGVNAGKPYAILIPQIWTITGEPKQVYRSQVLSGFRSSDPEGVTPMPSSTVYENAQYFNYVVSDVSGMLSGDIVSIIPVQFSGLSNSSKNMIANTVFPVTNVNYAENKITVHVKSPKQRKLMDDIQNKIIGGFIESSNPSFRLWESSGLFLAKARGSTLREAIANASNYGKTLSRQQLDVVKKRFPRGDYSNTPGAA